MTFGQHPAHSVPSTSIHSKESLSVFNNSEEVLKYISDQYPTNIGVISGVVGLAGGMGGFVLPIIFGALMDLTGVRSSAFMFMYGVVWVSLIWMYWTEVRGAELMGSRAKPFHLRQQPVAVKQGTS